MRTFTTIALLAIAEAIKTHQGIDEAFQLAAELEEAPEAPEMTWDEKIDVRVEKVDRLLDSCEWLEDNVDWSFMEDRDMDEPEDRDAIWEELWDQVKEEDEVVDADISEERGRKIATNCWEIKKFGAELAARDDIGDFDIDDFFESCHWLVRNVSEEAFRTEDLEMAWEDVKDKPEVDGWSKEHAGELATSCMFLAKHIEEDEGEDCDCRPEGPRRPEQEGEGEVDWTAEDKVDREQLRDQVARENFDTEATLAQRR